MARDDEHRSKRRKSSHERDGRSGERVTLPFDARVLMKEDMDEFREVFATYLKDKKNIRMDEISSTEAYARFKSFVHKWYTR